jgi:membrane-bound lytic murein transglycosylase B
MLFSFCPSVYADYSTHPRAKAFVDTMVVEHKFERDDITALLKNAEKKQAILDAIARPAEKTMEWVDYRKIFLGATRIEQGVQFWQENSEAIARAAKKYGVEPEIMVAIIGVETRYGRHAGKYRVLDALTTLGFDYPKRGKFFRGQLEQLFLLAREQKQDVNALTGSYAGAMGYGQFIPSSYRSFAVDFDGDGIADIWNNPVDAIGSVANYFNAHKWQYHQPVVTRARINAGYDKTILNQKTKPCLSLSELQEKGYVPSVDDFPSDIKVLPLIFQGDKGAEFWIGFENFYVITRYNRSHLYAMAVWQLSQEIKQGFDEV